MTNREHLLDNYEDAAFALLMEDFAQYRGEAFLAENERLKADPYAAVPELITRRSLNFIHKEFSKDKRHLMFGKLGKMLVRFIAVAALIALLFSAAYALSPQFRAGTLNLLMQFDEKAATFQFTRDTASDGMPELEAPVAMPTINIGWLPEGFTQHTPVNNRLNTAIQCTDETGNLIQIFAYWGDNASYNMDLEDADYYEELMIQEQPAVLVSKENSFRLTWANDQTGFVVHLLSDAVGEDALIQIAETITIYW